jgi:hypothetical protein
MLDAMAVRNLAEKTRHDYIRHVKSFASFLGRSPDTASVDDLRRFQLHHAPHRRQDAGAEAGLARRFPVQSQRPGRIHPGRPDRVHPYQ